MKFTCAVEINLPADKASALFYDENNLKAWQEGFVSKEHISGKTAEAGAKSKIVFVTGKHHMELTETVISNKLPFEMTALYEHKHMVNTMHTVFTPIQNDRSKLETHIEYTKFNGFVPKVMAVLFPGIFRKQTQKMFHSFKEFAESVK